MPDIVNTALCTACGGYCCKNYPGITDPADWSPTLNKDEMIVNLAAALKSGKWSIDWWEGDPRGKVGKKHRVSVGYFVRPAVKGNEGRMKDALWGGRECSLLTEKGCSLPYEKRPIECRLLVPAKKFPDDCTYPEKLDGKIVGKQVLSVRWIPYHDVIRAAFIAAGGDPDSI